MNQQIQIADIFLNEEFQQNGVLDETTASESWNYVEDGAADMD